MRPITNQPRPALPQGPGPEAPEETIDKACVIRGCVECSINMVRGAGVGAVTGAAALCCGPWNGTAVSLSILSGATVGASFSHNTIHTLCDRLYDRPVKALCERCERGTVCPPCPRLNTASSQADGVPVHYV